MNLYTFIIAFLQLLYIVESQKNIASNGTASQSSVFNWNGVAMIPNLAITGSPTNNFYSLSCAVTDLNMNEAWWMLTFPVNTVFVTTVKIFYRSDTLNRFALYYLYISNTSISTQNPGRPPYDDLCYHDVGPGNPSMNQSLDCYSLGMNVILYNNRTDRSAFLELCDVQVYGCYRGWYGNNCTIPCSSICIDKHCYPNNGTCVWGQWPDTCLRDIRDSDSGVCLDGCKTGLAGQYCNKYNLAANKMTILQPPDINQLSNVVTDGDRRTNSCVKTSGNISWLQIDLNSLTVITKIHLSYENNNTVKLHSEGHDIYVTNTSRSWTGGVQLSLNASKGFPYIIYDITPVIGQYVIYVPKPTNGIAYTDICEIEVIGCLAGKYGIDCDKTCPENCAGPCDPETGQCIFGCKDGWNDSFCEKPCTSPYFGNSCSNICYCFNGSLCNHVNGTCSTGGCQKGWEGNSCSRECTKGSYGFSCNESCTGCLANECERIDGICNITGRCNPGWLGPKCDAPCRSGFFGKNCTDVCHCINQPCDHITGLCPLGGCQRGYKDNNCSTNCSVGYFGFNCNESCDGCLSNSCDKEFGVCTNTSGCKPGWKPGYLKCDQACQDGYFGDCETKCYCLKGACNKSTGTCADIKCQKGWMGETCSKECSNGTFGFDCAYSCINCKNQSCERFEGNCTFGCKENRQCQLLVGETDDSSIMAGSIGGGISAAIVIVILFTVALFILRRRYKGEKEKYSAEEILPATEIRENIYSNVNPKTLNSMRNDGSLKVDTTASSDDVQLFLSSETLRETNASVTSKMEYAYSNPVNEDDENNMDHVYGNSEHELSSLKYNIAVTDLQSVINEKQINDGFKKEYEILPRGLVRPHVAGSKEENKAKNRFLNTWPYDHSRVVLQGNASNDYINASYIDSYIKRKAYIATQGPKKSTINDFWQMIWQENTEVIVMVTQLEEEEGKKKCEQYWPESSKQPLLLGIYKVSMIEESKYTVYVYRKLLIFNKAAKQDRTVHHFHFTQWPDHGVPDRIKLISFYRKVKLANTHLNGPMVVHCSAGLGRTGTFIAVDALYENGTKTGYVDIMEYVQIMRKDRMNMIQTKEQYEALYEALLEIFTVPDTAIGVAAYCQHLENLEKDSFTTTSGLRQEFQKIALLKPVYSSKSFSAALLENNTCKNVDQNILPHDDYRPFLMSFEGSRNDYINAVIIPGYEGRKFLVTQYPLQETVVDFWTMLYDNDCTAVVLLEAVKNIIPLWPKKGDTIEFKNFTVQQTKDNLPCSMQIVLNHMKKSDSRIINIIVMTDWSKENIPHSANRILELVDTVSQWQEQHLGPVTVVCNDGSRRSGLFVALYLTLEKIKVDKEVDIFEVVRMMQIRRPEFLSNFDQYKYCYHCIKDKLEEDESLYANT